MNHFNLIIIGAGPIGISCGIAAQKAGISYKIIEKGALVNSIHNFPEAMTFFSSADKLEIGNLPFTSLSRRPSKQEALEYYRRVTQHFDLNIGFYETFENVEKLSHSHHSSKTFFKITTSKETYTCNFIVNATGFYDQPNLLNISGETLPKVQHYYTSSHHLFRQKVIVIGASNSAVDVALEANRKGAEVTLVVRGNSISNNVKYWILPDLENRIAEGKIKVLYESNVTKIDEKHVLIKQKDKELVIENDFVYAMTGYKPNKSLFNKLKIDIDVSTQKPFVNSKTMETNTSGIYLAGVVCVGGDTQEIYIENSRDHGSKIIKHIKQQI